MKEQRAVFVDYPVRLEAGPEISFDIMLTVHSQLSALIKYTTKLKKGAKIFKANLSFRTHF